MTAQETRVYNRHQLPFLQGKKSVRFTIGSVRCGLPSSQQLHRRPRNEKNLTVRQVRQLKAQARVIMEHRAKADRLKNLNPLGIQKSAPPKVMAAAAGSSKIQKFMGAVKNLLHRSVW